MAGAGTHTARWIGYSVVVLGLLLALATAMEPQATGAYRLSGTFLLLGALPYIVYGSLTEVLDDYPFACAGFSLLITDLVARLSVDITSAARADEVAALYLCAVLILLALPAGAALGKLVSLLSGGRQRA